MPGEKDRYDIDLSNSSGFLQDDYDEKKKKEPVGPISGGAGGGGGSYNKYDKEDAENVSISGSSNFNNSLDDLQVPDYDAGAPDNGDEPEDTPLDAGVSVLF